MLTKIKSLIKNQYFIVFLLGSISASAFAPLYFFPSAFIAFSGLFLIANQTQSNKKSFWIGWWFGFGQFTFGLYWISISLFVDISQFFWLLPFALFLIPAVLAIYIGLTLLLTNFISKKLSILGWRKILLLAVIWTLFEYFRGVLFTGFPWNLLGYSFLFSLSLSQIASIFGVLGLSLIAIIVYCAPALIFEIKDQKIGLCFNKNSKIFLSLTTILVILILSFGTNRINSFESEYSSNSTFRLVQPNTKQENKWNPELRRQEFLENIILSRRPGFSDVNHVVW
ncbi:MAG: apolipoprotein N-acyltransferase, partial [Rickettsiales bacterium]